MLPWGEMWRAALTIGVPPSEFWTLSVREWRWLSSSDRSELDPQALIKLMKEHPDG